MTHAMQCAVYTFTVKGRLSFVLHIITMALSELPLVHITCMNAQMETGVIWRRCWMNSRSPSPSADFDVPVCITKLHYLCTSE